MRSCIPLFILAIGLGAGVGCGRPEAVILWRAGEGGVHTYRIPALAALPDGSLVAVADARRTGSGDLPDPIHLVARRSRDSGKTWDAATLVRRVPPEVGSVGDAALIVDQASGRVGCLHAFGPPGVGFFTEKRGLRIHLVWSSDGGRSWGAPEDLTSSLADPTWDACFVTSGNHPQDSKGCFTVTLVARRGREISSHVAIGEHGGRTWRRGGSAGPGDESRVAVLSDGTLVQNLRTPLGCRYQALSLDGGATFSPQEALPQVPDPGCNAGLVADGQDLWLVHCSDPKERRRLTLRRSTDGGKTWDAGQILVPGPTAYASLVKQRSGRFGILFEGGDKSPYEWIGFRSIRK